MTNIAPSNSDGSANETDSGERSIEHIARPYRALERDLERAILDRKEANLRVSASVAAMRDGGCTWAEIARILGTAPQTVHKKYSTPRAPRQAKAPKDA
ncbi:hypothetical protein [Cryobacterium sp. Y11]|uniref:hypothetical protein n=1 Tax=Cryobacterium sp. Y11 TaxID=2045016 RepID=UPI000CE56892|nr:hypothetical protein [Cryobacterium sp. Y11]